MGAMQERITSTLKGSITSVQAIYVPADDLTDPSPATTFSHLDATTVLSRQVAELGFYPAVDPLESSSRIMDPNMIGMLHYDIARQVKKILQDYKSFQVAETFTGTPGVYVALKDTMNGFVQLLAGDLDDIPELAFYMVGDIDEVRAKATKLVAEAEANN